MIITMQPIAVIFLRPILSERCPKSGIVAIEISACSITKLSTVPRGRPSCCVA